MNNPQPSILYSKGNENAHSYPIRLHHQSEQSFLQHLLSLYFILTFRYWNMSISDVEVDILSVSSSSFSVAPPESSFSSTESCDTLDSVSNAKALNYCQRC